MTYQLQKLIDQGLDTSKLDKDTRDNIELVKTVSRNFTEDDKIAHEADEMTADVIRSEFPDAIKAKKAVVTRKEKPSKKVKKAPIVQIIHKHGKTAYFKDAGEQQVGELGHDFYKGEEKMKVRYTPKGQTIAKLLSINPSDVKFKTKPVKKAEKKKAAPKPPAKPETDAVAKCKKVLKGANYTIKKKVVGKKRITTKVKRQDRTIVKDKTVSVFKTISKGLNEKVKDDKPTIAAVTQVESLITTILQSVDKLAQDRNNKGLQDVVSLLKKLT